MYTGASPSRNIGSPTPMRGPGAVPGLFATESAMNELADQLKIDPRASARSERTEDRRGVKALPFSSRHYLECLQLGGERFGWANRNAEVGSMKRDGLILGWGMAGRRLDRGPISRRRLVWSFAMMGSARVASGTQDIGTGT